MSSGELRDAITALPFQQFVLHIADGRSIPVIGRDFILLSPRGRTVNVYQPDDRADRVDMLLVTGLSFAAPPAAVPPQPADSQA